MVQLDSQANVSVFRDAHLLSNIRESAATLTIGGINADATSLIARHVGDFREFGTVWYHPDAGANIISLALAEDFAVVEYDRSRTTFTAAPFTGGVPYEFFRLHGMHVCDLNAHDAPSQVFAVTVEAQERQYTSREVKSAKEARRLIRALGYPSPRSVIDMINNGTLTECPVTAKDVARAYEIYGPDVGALRGKTTITPSIPYKGKTLPRTVQADQTFNVDIMFVDKHAFLLTVVTPLGLTLCSDLGRRASSRSKAPVRLALMTQISACLAQKYKVTTLLTDGEGAIASLTLELQGRGIVVNPAGPGQHVPVIERKIREVKERIRAIIATTPWPIADTLRAHLVAFVVSRINLVPHRGGLINVSPREAFTGMKANYKRDARCSFGDYCECTSPTTDNTMRPRTHPCIALYPTGSQGAVRFLSLDTGRTCTRGAFTLLPTPQWVIDKMTSLAARESILTPTAPDPLLVGHPVDLDGSSAGVEYGEDPLFADEDELVTLNADDAHPDPDDIIVELLADAPLVTPDQPADVEDDLVQYNEPLDYAPEPQNAVPEHLDPTQGMPFAFNPLQVPPQEDEDVDQSVAPPAPLTRYNTRSRGPINSDQHNRDLAVINSERSRRAASDSNVFNLTVKQALGDPLLSEAASRSIDLELQQMLDKRVFTPLHPHELEGKKKPIRSHMFLKEKFNVDGDFDKLRARLVGGGHMQPRRGVIAEDISSPTAAMPFLFAVASIAAKERRHVVTADVPVAYLNADNSRLEITMILEPDIAAAIVRIQPSYAPYRRSDGSVVVLLHRAIYGCIESARLWYNLLRATLEQDGFVVNPLDPCILNKEHEGVQCTVVIYVDDLKFTCARRDIIDSAIATLEARFDSKLKVTEGPVHLYLGMRWDYSVPGKCAVTMSGYTADVVAHSHVTGRIGSPAADHLFTVRDDAPALDADQREEFHTLVAKMLYLAKRVRPDILLPIAFLATRVQKPDEDDRSKLHRVLRYLNGTKDLGIVLEGGADTVIEAYIDASYGVHSDCRSHTGMVVTMGGAPIDTKSTKQRLNTKSSAEAELIALSDMCSRAIWCREFLIAQGYDVPPARVYQDNMSTIALATKGAGSSDRTRHVSIRYFWMKDRVASGDIEIVYKPTADMVADILTKPLHGDLFIRLRRLLLNWTC
jgi:hypothetical protein